MWLLPLLWAVYTSLRPYSDTAARGYFSIRGVLNFQNYVNAWTQADLPHYYLNTLIVVAARLVLTLLLSSFVGVRHRALRFASTCPADGLHGRQPAAAAGDHYAAVSNVPGAAVARWLSDSGVFFDSYVGIIAIHVAFQTGLLHVRAEQLHEDDPEGAHRGRAGRRRSVWQYLRRSSCRCVDRRWRRWRRSSSPGSTTTSSGPWC